MDATFVTNLALYSAQVSLLAAAGTVALAACRIHAAGVRHACWRALLALCLVLPWVQGRQAAGSGRVATEVMVLGTGNGDATAQAAAAAGSPSAWTSWAIALLAAGTLLRLAWIGIGLWRLRRLRRAGVAAAADHDAAGLQERLGVRAEIRYVDGLAQPVTFGLRRPVVLLPAALALQRPELARAVLCHELLHVQRRDWMWLLAEEGVRAVLWFHPAIWWLISRVQLSREERVDELTVLATGGRRAYIEALLAFADDTPLAPVAAFVGRRHLFHRMVLLTKEAVMSPRRVVLSCATVAFVVAASSWAIVDALPLQQSPAAGAAAQGGPGPLERRARPITPENPIPRRVFSTAPVHPPEAASLSAVIPMRITLDEAGRVAEARSLMAPLPAASSAETHAGIDAMIRAALDSVRQWQYDAPAEGPLAFNVAVAFRPDTPPAVTLIWPGDAMTGGFVTGFVVTSPASPPGAAAASSPWTALTQGAIKVGGAIRSPQKTKNVEPDYPPVAAAAQVQGVVILEVLVGADGRVNDARVLRSVPLLDRAALDAVRQWEFTPTLLNGAPVPIVMTVTVNFVLKAG